MNIREANAKWVYWSNGWLDRYDFLKSLVFEAEHHGFHVRQDTGWYDHDLEIYGDIWSRFYLTTATEELADGKMNLLCKIKLVWSPVAKALFWGAGCSVITLILICATYQPWVWMAPIGLPMLLWFIESKHLQTASTIGALIHQVAEHHHLQLIHPNCGVSWNTKARETSASLPQGA
jgi:hypothetical protein